MPKQPQHKKQKLPAAAALRAVRHRYAADVAKHAAAILKAAKSLQAIEKRIAREAIDIVGEDDVVHYIVTFDGQGSMEQQVENFGHLNSDYGPGINDIVFKAEEMMKDAEDVAASAVPPKLPHESDDE